MKHKKGLIITLTSIALIAGTVGLVVNNIIRHGGYFVLTDSEPLDKKELDKFKAQTTELLEWNYDGIDSVTFDWIPDFNGFIRNPKVPELAMTPMGSPNLVGYVNGDINKNFYIEIDVDNSQNEVFISGMYTFGFDELDKNPEYRISGVGNDDGWKTELEYDDIQELKKQGYTKDISIEEIKEYFDKKNSEENE